MIAIAATGKSEYELNGERKTTKRWSSWRRASSAIGAREAILKFLIGEFPSSLCPWARS